MSWQGLEVLLRRIFDRINMANGVESPSQLWAEYQDEMSELLDSDTVADQFVRLSINLVLPKAVEVARLLSLLRQRRSVRSGGNPLVARIRTEVLPRQRPPYNVRASSLQGESRQIAQQIGRRSVYSSFQIEGWDRVLNTIRNREGLVIIAPTGSGKTETFMLPILHEVATAAARRGPDDSIPRFVFLYPRVPLLKDQLARIFRYVYWAEQNYIQGQASMLQRSSRLDRGITIGFQFAGIKSKTEHTIANPEIFERRQYFRIVPECPICLERSDAQVGRLEISQTRRHANVTILECDNDSCGAQFRLSLSKNDHVRARPHILVTTYESLDRLYLTPTADFESYLRLLTGIVYDEAHLYYSIEGVHVYNLIKNIEDLKRGRGSNQPALAKIAASATISSPERFIAKLFYGDETRTVTVHDASSPKYEREPVGLEALYFIQSPDEELRPGAASTLIQSVMGIGHGLFEPNQRALVFTESVDMATRLQAQIQDAETNGRLWAFRTILNNVEFQGNQCPGTNPSMCQNLYLQGECWRGIIGGNDCTQNIPIRQTPLMINCVSSKNQGRYWEGDIVTATSALEVGVDDEQIMATLHYRPPRTVFSFIQRRGRAGRGHRDIAYTIMVLGNTASDQFYFYRRNRLLTPGGYELPLNTRNPVIAAMHETLANERERLRRHIQRFGPRNGILLWLLETLERCPAVDRYYGAVLGSQRGLDYWPQRRWILEWIESEQRRFESYLNLRWTLTEIEDECPDSLQNEAQSIRALVDQYLEGDQALVTQIGERLEALFTELSRLEFREQEAEVVERLRNLQNKARTVWRTLTTTAQTGMNVQLAAGFYDFFRTMGRLCEPDKRDWILNYAPDVLKTALQAFFYLGLSTREMAWHQGCQSCVEYFIPEAYFQQVKPLIVEVRTARQTDQPRLEQEAISELSTLLVPYRAFYRYHPHPFLSIVETDHNPDWVQRDNGETIVRLRLRGEGPRRQQIFRAQKVYVKAIAGDQQGDGIVKICLRCYAVYSETRGRPCHEQPLVPVKLWAESIVERIGRIEERQQISRTLAFVELWGQTVVRGSDVRATRKRWIPERYINVDTSNEIRFRALYWEPVGYEIPTKGIEWDLNEIIERVLVDMSLNSFLTQLNKTLSRELVLHTAAHMLNKAVASISGVNEELLEYAFDVNQGRVLVWERYDGGAGISEIIRDSIRTNPITLYRELLAAVICPIHLEERGDWDTPENLRQTLAERWLLPVDDEFLTTVTREAEAERQAGRRNQGENQAQPSCADGCPVCIRVTWCTERNEQALIISRAVGEAILRCLIHHVDTVEVETFMRESVDRGIVTPTLLFTDPSQRVSDVLLL